MALIQANFKSEVLKSNIMLDIVLPQPEGNITAAPDEKFKVLWLLHGATEDHSAWQRHTNIERYAER